MIIAMDISWYNGKKILVTGHTGFKGSWLCQTLLLAGAEVTGYSLKAPTDPALYELLHLDKHMKSIKGDIRDLDHMVKVFEAEKPEIVIHMAAQPLVKEAYKNPVYTYETNVMGTVNILECIRQTDCVKSFLNVTTDKVYRNKEWEWGYRENEELNGYDPYSNSKSCSELVTSSYANSYFKDSDMSVSTARAGNVIGGGDFARNRILPDCARAAMNKSDIILRNPYSTRPYQHVLDALSAYLNIVQAQYENKDLEGSYNVGPDENGCCSTGELATIFCKKWNDLTGEAVRWKAQPDADAVHEASFLRLDSSKIKSVMGWKPSWDIVTAVSKTAEWFKAYAGNEDMEKITCSQIQEIAGGKL